MIPWIQIYSNLAQHPKTARLADELGLSSAAVWPNTIAVGLLVCLWTWAIQNARSGDLSSCSPRSIAEACQWRKKPDVLIAALKASGYMDADGKLHDWDEYAWLLIEQEENRKAKTRERVKRYRDKKTPQAIVDSNVTETQCNADCNADCNGYGNVTVTECNAPTLPYPTRHNHSNYTTCGNKNAPTGKKESPEKAPAAMEYYLDKINPMASTTCLQELLDYVDALGDDVCIHAIDVARDERKTGWAFIRAIMQRYKSSGVRSVDDIKQLEMQRQQNQMTKTERLNAMVQKNGAPVSPVLRAAAARILTEKDGESK